MCLSEGGLTVLKHGPFFSNFNLAIQTEVFTISSPDFCYSSMANCNNNYPCPILALAKPSAGPILALAKPLASMDNPYLIFKRGQPLLNIQIFQKKNSL